MPKIRPVSGKPIPFRLGEKTIQRLQELADYLEMSQAAVIADALEAFHATRIPKKPRV